MSYSPVNLVHVSLDFGDHRLKVGRLAWVHRQVYFEYDPAFLSSRFEISPWKLPRKPGAYPCDYTAFEGFFGVFNDSLPDGWGRLLLDRQMRKYGTLPTQLTPLDRLSYVGGNGMGALSYEPVYEPISNSAVIHLDKLAAESNQILKGEAEDVFSELLSLSGSSAGARPKIMVGVSKDKKKLIHGQQPFQEDYVPWMIKFASNTDAKDIGPIEYAYSLMANASGLEMMPTYLFPTKKGAGYFGVERFDRRGDRRIHIHTVSGLLHADHRLPSLDYEQIMRATLQLTRNVTELEKVFRMATFNVFAHNRDDHSKNFSFQMNEKGIWNVAPAYDLTFSGGPGGEHSTTVMGEGKNPGKAHLLKLAEIFSLSPGRIQEIVEQIEEAIAHWPTFADEAGVSKVSKKMIGKVIAP